MMGLLYWRGRTVARDDRVAFEWMSKAAQRNNAEALNHLGSMYERGEGVERDAVQALRHFEHAPQLPSGYAAMLLLAYVPPLWFHVMDPRVVAHYGGDVRQANLQPSRRERLLARWGGPSGR